MLIYLTMNLIEIGLIKPCAHGQTISLLLSCFNRVVNFILLSNRHPTVIWKALSMHASIKLIPSSFSLSLSLSLSLSPVKRRCPQCIGFLSFPMGCRAILPLSSCPWMHDVSGEGNQLKESYSRWYMVCLEVSLLQICVPNSNAIWFDR